MFSGKQGNNLIETVHRRCLRAVLYDFHLSYEEMLEKTSLKTVHHKNLEVLDRDIQVIEFTESKIHVE